MVTLYFSKDRPAQLDLALHSAKINCIGTTTDYSVVLYKASDGAHDDGYTMLKQRYPSVEFVRQENFKKDLLTILAGQQYVMFVVDDCIFTNECKLVEIRSMLTWHTDVLGFSLRLGQNTKMCYPLGIDNEIPELVSTTENMFTFNWVTAGKGDFGYPLELSSSVYRVNDLDPFLFSGIYSSPNSLESYLNQAKNFMTRKPALACYKTSVAFCNPINKVQRENNNRSGSKDDYSTKVLLDKFLSGKVINYTYSNFVSNGCHQEVDIEMVDYSER